MEHNSNQINNVDTSQGDVSVVLADPSTKALERSLFFNASGSNRILFSGFNINGISTFKVLQGGSLEIFSDGSQYLITGGYNFTT